MNTFLSCNHIVSKIALVILVRAGAGARLHKNRQSHGLAFHCGGEKKYIFDDGTVCVAKKNDIVYLPKGSNYQMLSIEKGETYCINFQCLDGEQFQPFVVSVENRKERVLKAYQQAESAWKKGEVGCEYRCRAEVYKILSEMQKQAAFYQPTAKTDLLKPAFDYIREHYADELLNAEKLSKLCGISYDYFRRLFHGAYGCSPIEYINELKLKRAKELLNSGLYSVGEAAFGAGFSDVSHFSRFFKANVGVAPSSYKKIPTDN